MSQSLSQLYVHLIFYTKCTSVNFREQDLIDLYAYMGSIIKDNESSPILINGTEDHVHVFCIKSKNISLSDLTKEIKRHSSRIIKEKGRYYQKFAWQGGYGGFPVSPFMYEKTLKYIRKQKEHHKRMSFREEYLMFLKEYGVKYDERYLWTD